MKKLLFLVVLWCVYSTSAVAQDIELSQAKIRMPIPGMTNTAGYLDVANNSKQAITFVKASSPLAKRVEFHNHIMKNGVMKMVKLDSITLNSKQKLQFVSGGLHLMFLDINSVEDNKGKIPVSLYTENGKVITHDFKLVNIHQEDHGHHHH